MKEKSVVSILLQDAYIPKMAKVRQNFPRPLVENPAARVSRAVFSTKNTENGKTRHVCSCDLWKPQNRKFERNYKGNLRMHKKN